MGLLTCMVTFPATQVLETLPNDVFIHLTCKLEPHGQGYQAHGEPGRAIDLRKAVCLPPQLMVKWLRTDCCTTLDLASLGDFWTLDHWQMLVGCLHAVPALLALKVSLLVQTTPNPRYIPCQLPENVPLLPERMYCAT